MDKRIFVCAVVSTFALICFYQILNRNKIALTINCRRWGWPLSRLPFEQFPTSSPSSPLRRQAKSLECLWEFTLRSAVHFCVWRSLNLYQHSTGISRTDTTWYSYCLSAQQPLSVIVASASSSSILDIRIPHYGTIIKFFLWNVSEKPQHIRRVSHSRRLLCIAAFILYRHFCRMVVKTHRLFLYFYEKYWNFVEILSRMRDSNPRRTDCYMRENRTLYMTAPTIRY